MNKEIYKEEELIDIIKETVNDIAETVEYTYGPNGNTVIITDQYNNPYTTKDGVSVTRAINYQDPIKNYIATLIKQVAEKTLEEAGDATTTSICLTNTFINKGLELLDENIPYSEIKQSLEKLEKYTIKYLKDNSKDIKDLEELYHVAFIASNNDKNIATIVKKAYKHSNIVKVEEGDSFEDKLVPINGMQLKTTYFDSSFINKMSSKSIEYNHSQLIIVNGKINKFDTIVKLLSKDVPNIIIAEDFNEDVVTLLKRNYNKNIIKVALVKSPGMGSHRYNLLEDIADYTGATILDPKKSYVNSSYTGKITGIEVKKEQTILFNEETLKPVTNKIEQLENYLKEDISDHEKELTTQRIEGLKGSTSIIKVGGNSPIEMKERLDRIDDAVRAVGCALEEGISEGGGATFAKCYNKINKDLNNLDYSLSIPFRKLNNSKEITQKDINKNMFKYNIIDPTKVLRCALQNAISVSKTLLNTKALIVNKLEWKK